MCFGVFVGLNDHHVDRKNYTPMGYVIQENGCWEWTGALNDSGYGNFWAGGRAVRAHRYMYERTVGPIPIGLTLDHLCRNPSCVNPDHLEPVTVAENLRRGFGVCAQNARKTHCKRGHLLEGDNIISVPRGRNCRICVRASNKRSDAKRSPRPPRKPKS